MFVINVIAMILILIGALNWGLVGFFNYNFVSVIFGGSAMGDYSGFDRFVFAIVGLAGIWGLSFLGRLGALSYGGGGSSDNLTIKNKKEEEQKMEEDFRQKPDDHEHKEEDEDDENKEL